MEICIKWNVCRVCLEESKVTLDNMRCIFNDPKLAKQIYDCAGVMMKPNDSLPEKICHHCLQVLKNAVHFRTTCRNSNEYLQSVVRKTKSATSLLKMNKHREETMGLVVDVTEEIFDKNDVDANALLEEGGQGDSANHKQMNRQIPQSSNNGDHDPHEDIDKQIPQTNAVDLYEASESNQTNKNSIDEVHPLSSTVADSTLLKVPHTNEKELSVIEIVMDEGESEMKPEQEFMEEPTMSKIQYKKENYGTVSECSVEDDGYIEEGDEENNSNPNLDDSNTHVDSNVKAAKSYIVVEPLNEAIRDIEECSLPTPATPPTEIIANNDNEGTGEMFYLINGQEMKTEIEQYTVIEMTTEVEEFREEETRAMSLDAMEDVDYLVDEVEEENLELALKEQAHQSSTALLKSKTRKSTVVATKSAGKINSFVCEECGNHFLQRGLLNCHMRIHRNEKKYQCELCFKRFNAACNLSAHMRIHTGEKRYECQFCARRFTDRSTHIKHERIHTNEKPFTCIVCGKSFSLSTSLKAHEKIHTDERPYACQSCDKSFKLGHQLKAHKNTQLHKMQSAEPNSTTKPAVPRVNRWQ